MEKLDELLSGSAEENNLPPHFVSGVMERVEHYEFQKQRRSLLLRALFLSLSFCFFFYALSNFLIDAAVAHTVDFLSVVFLQPSLLTLAEGRLALLEAIPAMSLLLTCIAISLCIYLLHSLWRSISSLSPFHFHYAF